MKADIELPPVMEQTGTSIASQTPEAVLQHLGSSRAGLSAAEVLRRQGEFGPNRVEGAARQPLWWMLLREFGHFFAILLWVAAALAFVAAWRQPGQGMAELGVAIVGVIVVNGCFSFWQAYRSARGKQDLQILMPDDVEGFSVGVVKL